MSAFNKKFLRAVTTVIAIIIIIICIGCGISRSNSNDVKSVYTNNSALINAGKTVIKRINGPFEYSHPFVITSEKGTTALLDPYKIPVEIDADIVTVSHTHFDHIDKAFLKRTKARVSNMTKESFEAGDIKVTGIPSDHGSNQIDEEKPDNFIYLFEVDGLRIAHFGDIGQDTLTDEQLKALGRIDIAIMIFLDYPSTNNSVEKSCKLMEQLKPQIILSHEYSPEGIKKIGEIVGSFEKIDNEFAFSKSDLEKGERKVIELNYKP